MTNKERILSISKKLGLSHIGSNLSCLTVLEEIYAKKKPKDLVILDNAHAHLAHIIVKDIFSIEPMIKASIERHGIHCDRQAGCDATGGSLGHGLGIAIGYALADKKRDVYVIVSEGSMSEGSSWEALRLIEDLSLQNIKIYTNFNGYSAVAKVNSDTLTARMRGFIRIVPIEFRYTENGEGFDGVQGHYRVL